MKAKLTLENGKTIEKELTKAQQERLIETSVKAAIKSICPFPFITRYMD